MLLSLRKFVAPSSFLFKFSTGTHSAVSTGITRARLRPIVVKFPASPTDLAFSLATSEAKVRSQMINPKSPVIDKDEGELISLINGYKVQQKLDVEQEDTNSNVKPRAPIVTIMGHVDHGKTTLLDFLRSSNIAKNQFGGITQKIGAFNVKHKGKQITFIDTPGHQAFVNMRLRGATVTDMIVVVVSATEGVKQQTMQVIDLARNSNIPFIVAINKIDILEADPEEVEKELLERGIVLESQGGTIPVIHLSAKTGLNVDFLIQLILEQAEQDKIRADFGGPVEASVLEAYSASSDMNSASILIQKGTLKPGAVLVVGSQMCRVKAILDDNKQLRDEAYPGQAVQIAGFKQLPCSGDLAFEVTNESKARFIIDRKLAQDEKRKNKQVLVASSAKIKIKNYREKRQLYKGFADLWLNKFKEVEDTILEEIEEIQEQPDSQAKTELLEKKQRDLTAHKLYVAQYLEQASRKQNSVNLLIKSSDRGSEETVLKQVAKLKKTVFEAYKVEINILRSEVGDIYESDIVEANLFKGHIFCFGTGFKPDALRALKTTSIVPHNHKLLHTFLDDLRSLCEVASMKAEGGLKQKGTGQIAEVFRVSQDKKNYSMAAGIKVDEGRICKKYKYKIFRNGKPVSEIITISSLKHFKKEVIELKKGQQCTVLFQGKVDFQKGDILKAYQG